MSYIAFMDMIGTRASAMISNEEYTNAINDFNNALEQVSNTYQCTIYGYSDNAYIEINDLLDTIKVFRLLRETLMYKHRYFTAAVDRGSLSAKRVRLDKSKGFSMKFTAPATVDIYMKQCQFSGVGISLSQTVIDELKSNGMQDSFRQSVYQQRLTASDNIRVESVYDLSYSPVILEKIEYIMADYLITAATNERASRYYITPIITMLKCLDPSIISTNLSDLIALLSFQGVPKSFQTLPHIKEYSIFFMFALIEFILSLRQNDKSIDAVKICEQIISSCNIECEELVKILPIISKSIITNENKRQFLNILYNFELGNLLPS